MKKQTVRCLMCGELMQSDAESYAVHVRVKHSMGGIARVIPIKTSNRTSAQIIEDVERMLEPFIIYPEGKAPRKGHDEVCRCTECFNVQLDRILAGQHITWKGEENVFTTTEEN